MSAVALAVVGVVLAARPPPGGGGPGGGPGISFLVLGDWGRVGAYDSKGQLLDADGAARQSKLAPVLGQFASDREASFVVSTGDNFFENGGWWVAAISIVD